jgi:hypothetical protein
VNLDARVPGWAAGLYLYNQQLQRALTQLRIPHVAIGVRSIRRQPLELVSTNCAAPPGMLSLIGLLSLGRGVLDSLTILLVNGTAGSINCLLLLCGQDPLNLLEVIEIVSREHPDDRFDGLRAAFVVHAVVLPLIGRESLE